MEDRRLELKTLIYKISASTDRGQRLNSIIAPMYQDKKKEIETTIEKLIPLTDKLKESALEGKWELIYSSVELFRSSPFFLAIENAFDNKKKSDLFFKLHFLQVCSFGLSTIGKVEQNIDLNKKELISTFDTTIFGLTVIPILGWFKLLPTFGGRVVTLAKDLKVSKDNKLHMLLDKTKVSKVDGLNKIPFFSKLLMEKWYPVLKVWNLLPWNKKEPICEMQILYIDNDIRIVKDIYEGIFIYSRPIN
tara:strand:- start:333 stop:1076 length:744 start_codon:yes stop_codon:yes gene_type:complete